MEVDVQVINKFIDFLFVISLYKVKSRNDWNLDENLNFIRVFLIGFFLMERNFHWNQ